MAIVYEEISMMDDKSCYTILLSILFRFSSADANVVYHLTSNIYIMNSFYCNIFDKNLDYFFKCS